MHLHEQHFDKLGDTYGPDDIVPCYWCCRPCVTKRGQSRANNHLPSWSSHEKVCRENPNNSNKLHNGHNGYSGYASSEVDSIDERSRGGVDDHRTFPLEEFTPPGA